VRSDWILREEFRESLIYSISWAADSLLSHPSRNIMLAEAIPDSSKVVYLLKPRGFCAGVVRAIDIVELALEAYGPPIYVRREIVHNRHVVKDLASRGALFVEELDEVPNGQRVIYSAHGVAPAVRTKAAERDLKVIDATCPLVTKVHVEAVKFAKQGGTILLIGHPDHEEVVGTLGEAPEQTIVVATVEEAGRVEVDDPQSLFYLTQTTLSLDEAGQIIAELKRRFPKIQGPPAQDICYATENRQQAVKKRATDFDLLLVVGSQNSSNSKRLVEVGVNGGVPGHLIDDEQDIEAAWLRGVRSVGITAGASAPEILVDQVVTHLRTAHAFGRVEEVEVIEENVRFPLPAELAKPKLTQIAV